MRRNEELTRITCSGIVDRDHYEEADVENLNQLGIAVLGVSEIENIFLLPDVSRTIAEHEGLVGEEIDTSLAELKAAVFASLEEQRAIDKVVARSCRRRIDRAMKRIDLSGAASVEEIEAQFAQQTEAVDVNAVAATIRAHIEAAVEDQDLEALLAVYDNKGLLALGARHLKRTGRKDF